MRTEIRRTLGILVLSGTYISAVDAAEWSIDPHIQVGAGYNDNIRLSTDNEASSAELNVRPSVLFAYETPSSGINGNLAFNVRRFPEESDFDDETANLSIGSFRNMERAALGFGVNLIKDTTLDTELEETGLAFDRIDRVYAAVTPRWSYSFNEKTSMSLSYTHTDVDYDSGRSGYTDYASDSGSVSLSRVINERSIVSISAGYNYTDNDNGTKSQYSNVRAGGSYQLSETLSSSLFVGLNYNETEYTAQSVIPIFADNVLIGFTTLPDDAKTSNDGFIFNASLNKTFLRGSIGVSASRSISNSVSGALVEVSRIGLRNEYRFSETVSGNLNMSFSNTETANELGSNLDRDYYQVIPGISWKFKEFWDISASYSYKKQTLSSNNEQEQNAAYLTLNYNWPRIAISR